MVLAVRARAVEKTYGGALGARPALAGVDLEVPTSASFGLIGLNGAGKTTFIKTLLGIVRPTRGELRVLGGDPDDVSVRRSIGYLPERLAIPRSFGALAFLVGVARIKGIARPREEALRQLARVGLERESATRVSKFSKGMRQRLGLAAALLGRPALLVLDEPTDGVDPLGRVEIRRILLEERTRGATLFLNSHLLAETERVCDRIAILHQGKVVVEGTIEALAVSDRLWRVRVLKGSESPRLIEIGFEPVGAELKRDGEASRTTLSYRFKTDDPSSLNEALDRARSAGAIVVELLRETRDLEDVLSDHVSGPSTGVMVG
ncbi:MAG: ABC transporter ATP-binding protein [Deltaproteobacteria bacterium]|nr:ABC transporter ATP-binding protein [Deltaproteobacteria bacterium]